MTNQPTSNDQDLQNIASDDSQNTETAQTGMAQIDELKAQIEQLQKDARDALSLIHI